MNDNDNNDDDYRKANNMTPYCWILETLQMIGRASNIRHIIKESMQNWKTMLTADGEIRIRRGIFQADSLLLLLF